MYVCVIFTFVDNFSFECENVCFAKAALCLISVMSFCCYDRVKIFEFNNFARDLLLYLTDIIVVSRHVCELHYSLFFCC